MNGIDLRLSEIFCAEDGHSLIVDASAGLSLGVLPGLEIFKDRVGPILNQVDGIVLSPGQLLRLDPQIRGQARLFVRMDWSNTLRGPGFFLPAAKALQLPILSPTDAAALGAAAMVTTFLLGYEEEIEAACLRNTVLWAIEGKHLGLPLVVEISASGPRISLPQKAVELGASYALEAGADLVVVPYPGRASLETIAAFVSVPWLVKPSSTEGAPSELDQALQLGSAGLWLDHKLFALPDWMTRLRGLAASLHPAESPG